MARVLIFSRRGPLLQGLLGATSPGPVEWFLRESIQGAFEDLSLIRPDALVVDACSLERGELSLVLGLSAAEPSRSWIAVVSAGAAEPTRQVLRHGFRILLDPFDLEQVATTLKAALAPPAPAVPHDPEALALFLRGIAHEILNPLTSISGLAQLELGEAAEDTPRAQRHRTILREAERIQGVVRSLELFLREHKPRRRLLDFGELVREAVRSLELQPDATRVAVEPGCPPVLADSALLTEAIASLVQFAAEPEGAGRVQALVRPRPGGVEVEVRGSRRLRLPEPPTSLFLPFHPAAGRNGRPDLHLAAAFGVLRGHQGALHVSSSPEGEVCFRAFLPVASLGGEASST